MKIPLLISFLFISLFNQLKAQPKRELRGAWVATYANIDWPNRTQTPAQQRTALITILDHHKATGINTVYIQIRSQCDAMYPSTIEPWSADLTGTQGNAPNPIWDPLQFMIDETHKRGMEFHAWINPYRAVANTANLASFSANHVAKKNPSWMLTVGTVMIMNPGLQAVRDHITSVITDVVTRYDVDGIHFDDYFYPSGTINDNATFTADPRGFTNVADWRRDNINLLIKGLYEKIKQLKSWVKFGVSPSGIYRNGVADGGSATTGQQHYSVMYADTKRWLQEGWVDYIAPQVYWYIGQPGSDYSVLVPWWNNQAANRHIYIGMAGYKVNEPGQATQWFQTTQIPNQIKMNRSYPNVYGQSIYNTSSLRSTTRLGFRDSLKNNYYAKPALIPTMPWRDDVAPDALASLVALKYGNDSVVLNWNKSTFTADELNKVKKIVVYRSESLPVDISNPGNILTILLSDTTAYNDKTVQAGKTYNYIVTALDRFSNESAASNTASNTPPAIDCPSAKTLFLTDNCNTSLSNYTNEAVINGGIQSSMFTVTQTPAAGTSYTGLSTVPVMLTVRDKAGNSSACQFNIEIKDSTKPIINCAPSVLASTDADVCTASLTLTQPTATDNCGVTNITSVRSDGKQITAPFEKGVTTITWTAYDAAGNTASCSQTVTVEDKQAPRILNASVSPEILKAPNHKMRDVSVNYSVSDNCGPVNVTVSVSSNEPENGTGDGDTSPDWAVIDEHNVQLRAERAGNGKGRIYTITITATDADGNTTTEQLKVVVPHDQGENEPLAVASPNPSKNKFTVQLKGLMNDAAIVIVTDSKGIKKESFEKLKGNSTVHFGAGYQPGIYYAEITIGEKKQTIQLIKE